MVLDLVAVAGGAVAALASFPYFGYVGYVYKFKVMNIIRYKAVKNRIYKGIHKAIAEQDIQSLRDYLDTLKHFDAKYSRVKLPKIKKKLGINDEILNDRKLFKMKYDSDYLVEHALGIYSSSSSELQVREKQLLDREKSFDNLKDIDSIRQKEIILRQKEKELIEKEKEIIEIISNLSKL